MCVHLNVCRYLSAHLCVWVSVCGHLYKTATEKRRSKRDCLSVGASCSDGSKFAPMETQAESVGFLCVLPICALTLKYRGSESFYKSIKIQAEKGKPFRLRCLVSALVVASIPDISDTIKNREGFSSFSVGSKQFPQKPPFFLPFFCRFCMAA